MTRQKYDTAKISCRTTLLSLFKAVSLPRLSALLVAGAAAFFFVFTVSSPFVCAQDRTYHVGSTHAADNVTYFATLEDLRIATTPTGIGNYYNLHDGDKIILYQNDNSLTDAFDMGTEAAIGIGIVNSPTITVVSNDAEQQRTVTPATAGNFPIFRMNYPTSNGSTLNMDGIILQNADTYGGAIYAWWHNNLNIANSKFIGNKDRGVGGGAIYYWDALDAYITDTDFIGNAAMGSGGAMFINNSISSVVSDTTNVTLEVTAGKTMTFRDNYDNVYNLNDPAGTGQRNSIDFTGAIGKHINLNIIAGTDAVMDMQDPFRTNVGMGLYTVDITKTGGGTWRLGGVSRVEGSGGTKVLIETGTLELTDSAELLTIGTNDSFTVRQDAELLLRGNNAVEGTKVIFEPGAYLTFDMDFYKINAKSDPMLALSGTTLQIEGTTVSIINLPTDSSRNGEYLLIRGDSPLKAGNFDLLIGSEKVNISGNISSRFGYSLGNTVREEELILRVHDQENAVIKWKDNTDNDYRGKWSVYGMNWTLPYRSGKEDGFVPGDTVVFEDMSGDRTVRVVSDSEHGVLISPVADSGYTFYKDNGIGMHVAGAADWKFTGSKISDGYDPSLAGDAGNDAKKAALYYTGSGSLRLENNEANEFHGNVIHAGTGTIYVSQLDKFGKGDAFEFRDNGTTDTSKIVFTNDISAAQTFDKQFRAGTDSSGYVANGGGTTLTLTSEADTIADVDGGKLTFKGTSRDNFLVKNNQNKSINVKNGGEFIADEITVSGNSSATGLIIAQNSNLTLRDSDITGNAADAAAVIFSVDSQDKTLALTASDGQEFNISGNKKINGSTAAGIAVGASGGYIAAVNINAEGTGTVNMFNPMNGSVNGWGSSIAVEKTGTGIWNLAGANTFQNYGGSLSLNVSEGTLVLLKQTADYDAGTLTLPSGNVFVDSGAVLLSQGGNKITAASFTLANNSTLGFDLTGITGETPNPVLLDVAATVPNLTNNANIDLVNLNLSRLEGDDKRTINLAHFNNTFTNANLTHLTLQYNGTDMKVLRQNFAELVYDKDGGKILAVELSAPIVGLTQWANSSGSRVWNQTDKNWNGTGRADGDLTGTTQFLDGDAVEFIGGSAAQTVSVDSKGVRIADQKRAAGNTSDPNPIPGMTVNNAAGQDYTFRGGSINGDGSLVKKGTGNLIFENSNGFTGLTTIENGKVVLKKVDSLGTEGGAAVLKNGSQNGTLEFAVDKDNSGQFTQHISGGGTLLKTESGSVILTEASPDFTGSVNIRQGELGIADIQGVGAVEVNTGDNSGNGTFAFAGTQGTFTNKISGEGKVRVGSNANGDNANVELSGVKTYTGGTTVDSGSVLTITQFGNTGTGNIAVNGTLDLQFGSNHTLEDRNITGTGLIEKNLAAQLDFESRTDFAGTFRLNDGSIRLSNSNGLQNATLDYQGGTVDFGTNTAAVLGGLSGGINKGKRLGIVLENNDGRKVALTVGNNNTEQTYTGELSGSGSFIKTGTGTQILDGVNTYKGGTLVRNGRLTGTDVNSFGTGSVENNSELEFRIGAGKSQTYSKLLAGTGMLIKGGEGTLTLTGDETHTGNTYTGGTSVESGILNVNSLQALGMNIKPEAGEAVSPAPSAGTVIIKEQAVLSVDIDSGTTADADTVITKNISGLGTLVKKGSGSLSMNTDTTLSGKIEIQNGIFYLNGNTAAAVDVLSGAVLSGIGSSDNLVHFYNGSSHYINNKSVNVLGVFRAENIRYDSGSTVYIKIGPNGSDLVAVNNLLDFAPDGGKVNVRLINLGSNETAAASASSKYEIFTSSAGQIFIGGHNLQEGRGDSKNITAAGGEASVQLSGEGVNILGYEVAKTGNAKGIFVDVLLDGTFDSGLNSNQTAVLSDIGTVPVLDAVFNRTGAARGGLLNELMPMVQTALPYINNRSITHFNEGVFNRLRFLNEPVYQPVFRKDETAYSSLPSPAPLYRGAPKVNKRSLWFQNYGDFTLMQENGIRPEFRISSYGFNVGSDRPVTRCSDIGFGMGGNFSNAAVNKFGQRADIDSFLIAAYGDWFNEYGWMLTGSAGIVANQCNVKRNVYSLDTQISSEHNGTSFFVSLEGSKKFRLPYFDVSPFAGIDLIWLTEERYNERLVFGDSSLPLNIAKNETNSILSTAGLRVGRTFRLLGGNIISPTAYLAWVHNYNVGQINTWAWFPGQNGFSITGASMYRDRAKAGMNLDMTLNNRLSMYTRFDAELGNHLSDLSVQWGIQFAF